MRKYKFGLVSIFLFATILINPSFVAADIFYRVPSFGLGSGSWTSVHFYYSEGDTVIIQWFVPVGSSDTIDVMVLDKDNYSNFTDGFTFDTFYVNNDSSNGFVIYQEIPEDLYFMVFTNDQPGGMNFGYQFSLIEADTTCNCNCNCTYTPDTSPSPATISGFITLTLGLVTVVSIWLITKKIKVKNLQ